MKSPHCILKGFAPRPLFVAVACLLAALLPTPADEIEDALNQQRDFNAVQSVYRAGVPHTDPQGRVLTAYDAQRSFFPIATWGAPLPGKYYESECDWNQLKGAGFNSVWPWAAQPQHALDVGKEYGMQIVLMGEIDESMLPAIKDHPNLLGNVWMDDPIGRLGSADMDALFAQFTAYRDRTRKIAESLPVFVNDAPWIMPPATSWWLKWNSAGDISCHDNYPVMNHTARAASIGADPNGIPQSVALAVGDGKEQKPVWLIVGAFDQPGEYGQAFPFRYPTPEQLRACVYAGIIQGATGIVYFIWDNYVPRDGGVIGMSPNPQAAYVPNPRQEGYPRPTPATPLQLIAAKALWETAAQVNKELGELTPVILSPTCGPDVAYSVHIEGKAPTTMPIRTLLKPHAEGGYVLLTVNLDDALLKVTYTFPQPLSQYQLLYENTLPQTPAENSSTFT
ncbi:MAG: hypothetical protein WC655_25505, partial [Candidatus Hydrogenedentales bacterium]